MAVPSHAVLFHAAAAERPPPATCLAELAPAAAHPPGPAATEHGCNGGQSARCGIRAATSRIGCLMARAWPAGRPLQHARRPAAWRSSPSADGDDTITADQALTCSYEFLQIVACGLVGSENV